MLFRPLKTAGCLAAAISLGACLDGRPILHPDPPGGPDSSVYQVPPPAGMLPWPHHVPAWDQARYDAMLDSIWVVNNHGAYTGTADRSALYLHNALDLVLPNGTPIHAIAPGLVRSVSTVAGPFYSSLVIEDRDRPGYGWLYAHTYDFTVDEGDTVTQGTLLGVVSFQGIEHIHLARVRLREGGHWRNFRDLYALQPDHHFVFRDSEAPEFVGEFRYVRNMSDSAFIATSPAAPPTISGDVDIIVALRDPGEWTRSKTPVAGIPAFGDAHAVSRVEYDIRSPAGAVHSAVAFDLARMELTRPSPEGTAAELLTLYQHYESADPPLPAGRWGHRRFNYYVLTNSDGSDAPAMRRIQPGDQLRAWRTGERTVDGTRRFPDGEYTVTVRAFDSRGNMAQKTGRVIVRN